MNMIICIDNNNGISFGGKHLSRDAKLCERVLQITSGNLLLMNKFSYGLFKDYSDDNIIVTETVFNDAKPGDFCFVENLDVATPKELIEKIIIYRWNRSYPSDMKLDMSILNDKKLVASFDFAGNSHKKITEEIYE